MASIILLSRMRGHWVAWRQGRAQLTGFGAPTPAADVLLHFTLNNPDVLVAVRGRAESARTSSRPAPGPAAARALVQHEESESLTA